MQALLRPGRFDRQIAIGAAPLLHSSPSCFFFFLNLYLLKYFVLLFV
jgi:hypothetical protein